MRVMIVMMALLYPFITNSKEESAQTSLHCMLSDDATKHLGAYFS